MREAKAEQVEAAALQRAADNRAALAVAQAIAEDAAARAIAEEAA